MKKHQFGISKSEVNLVAILDEKNNAKLKSYCSRSLAAISRHLKNIKLIDNSIGTKDHLYKALKAHYISIVENSKIISDKAVASHLKNCIVIRLRRIILKK